MIGFKSCLYAAFLVGSVTNAAPDAPTLRHEEGLLETPSELVAAGAQVFANGVGALVNAGNNLGQAFGLPAFNPSDAGAAISQTVEPVVRPLKEAFGPYINSVNGLVPSTFQDAFKRTIGFRPSAVESSGYGRVAPPNDNHNNGGNLSVEPDVVFATPTLSQQPETRALRAFPTEEEGDDTLPRTTQGEQPVGFVSTTEDVPTGAAGSAPPRATWGYYYPYSSYYYGYPSYYGGYWPSAGQWYY